MRGTEFAELAAFAAIAERGSFVKAAAVLGVSTSTLSQTLRSLEERLGVRLLNRTTRSVALTEAGERLLAQINPALEQLGTALETINAFRDTPAGLLRLSAHSLATGMVLAPHLAQFHEAYPDIVLDVSVDDGTSDIVAGRFDAGIRSDWRIERDMIAVRISPESRLLAVASPAYLARNPVPRVPQDLHAHNCLRYRMTDGGMVRWMFEREGERVEVQVEGSFLTNNFDLTLQAAVEGLGVAYTIEGYIKPMLADRRLVPVLEDWSQRFAGWHIYYPSRRQMPLPLKVFIDFLRRQMAEPASAHPAYPLAASLTSPLA